MTPQGFASQVARARSRGTAPATIDAHSGACIIEGKLVLISLGRNSVKAAGACNSSARKRPGARTKLGAGPEPIDASGATWIQPSIVGRGDLDPQPGGLMRRAVGAGGPGAGSPRAALGQPGVRVPSLAASRRGRAFRSWSPSGSGQGP